MKTIPEIEADIRDATHKEMEAFQAYITAKIQAEKSVEELNSKWVNAMREKHLAEMRLQIANEEKAA